MASIGTERLIKRRQEKVELFLENLGRVAPIVSSPSTTLAADLHKNKTFHTLIEKEFEKWLTKLINGKEILSVRIRTHLREAIKEESYCYDDLTNRAKLDMLASTCEILRESSTGHARITEQFMANYIGKTTDKLLGIAWEVIVGSMIVDSMQDVEERWLDIGVSISQTAIDKYLDRDNTLMIKNQKVLEKLDSITADYVDYLTMMLGLNILKFVRHVDEESKSQILGNIGDITEFRDVAKTVFINEILSEEIIKDWLVKFVSTNLKYFK